jgi:HlyD family secretion protein
MRNASIVVLLMGLGGGAYLTVSTGERKELRIATAEVTRGAIIDAVRAYGRLEPITTVDVGAQVSGRIADVLADFNDIVQRGDVLARIDPSIVETQIAQARAIVHRLEVERERLTIARTDAQRKLDRATTLWRRSLITQAELQNARVAFLLAEAQLRSAQAQLAQAAAVLDQREVDLQQTVIRAPIDGIVVSRRVDAGQTVSARMQTPVLFELAASLTTMRALAAVREADIGRVRAGQPVTFRVDAYPSEAFTGVINQVRINPIQGRGVTTYMTVIDVPNGSLKLRPGMTADMSIKVAERHDAVRVPASAIAFTPSSAVLASIGADSIESPSDGLAEESLNSTEVGEIGAPLEGTEPSAVRSADEDLASSAIIDELLAPPIPVETVSQEEVWVLEDGELMPVDVVVGISDGRVTELIAGELQPGDEVVWSVRDSDAPVRPELSMRDLFRRRR